MTTTHWMDEQTALICIRLAAAAAMIAGAITVLAALTGQLGFTAIHLIDAAVFFGLAYGMHRKSRVCAVVLLVLHTANRYDMWKRTHGLEVVFGLSALTFFALYILGIVGTFAYHAIQHEKTADRESAANK